MIQRHEAVATSPGFSRSIAPRFTVSVVLLLCTMSLPADVEPGRSAYQAGDYATALQVFLPLADAGDRDAQYWVGRLYDEGAGVDQDYEEGAEVVPEIR